MPADKPLQSATFTLEASGRILGCNQACLAYLGYASAGELIGNHISALIGTSGEAATHPILSCAKGDVSAFQGEGVLIRPDGTFVLFQYEVQALWLDWSRRGASCSFIQSELSTRPEITV